MTDATGVCYTQSGNVKRYESTLGPSFDTNTIGAIITRTNSGDNTYEYKVTASGYDISTSGTKVVVKYGPSSAEAKKTFYFSNSNYYSVELRIVEYTYSYGSSGDGTGGTGNSAFKIYSVVKDRNNKNIDWANAGPTGHDFDWTDNPKYLINVYAVVKTTLYRNDIPSGESYTDIEIRNLSIPFGDSDFYYRDDDAVALFNYYPIDINGDGEELAIDSYSIENGYGKGLEYFPKYSSETGMKIYWYIYA